MKDTTREMLVKLQNVARCRDYDERKDYYKANEKKSIALIIASGILTTAYLVGLVKFVNTDLEKKEEE